MSNELLNKEAIDKIKNRFQITERLSQCVGKQAKENVSSQNMCINTSSGVSKMIIPFNLTSNTNKFKKKGQLIGKSCGKYLNCAYIHNANHNASKNIELLGLAGVCSLCSLTNFEDRINFHILGNYLA